MKFSDLKKYIFQSVIYLLEIIIVYLLINGIFIYFYPTESFFELSRFLGIYALYQLFVYSTLKLANDAKKDSYSTLKTKNEEALIIFEYFSKKSNEYLYHSNTLKNEINLQLDDSVFNEENVKKYYLNLIKNIGNGDIFSIKMDICHINHYLRVLDQEFLLSFLLRIIKTSIPNHVKEYLEK